MTTVDEGRLAEEVDDVEEGERKSLTEGFRTTTVQRSSEVREPAGVYRLPPLRAI